MGLSIGETSDVTGLSADTLRYYESIGLLGPVARSGGGQRRYSSEHIARLRFVRRARAMDFTLDEIGQLLELRSSAADVRADVRALTETKLAAVEQRIGALIQLRDELAELVRACRASERDCPIIQRIDSPREIDHDLHDCC